MKKVVYFAIVLVLLLGTASAAAQAPTGQPVDLTKVLPPPTAGQPARGGTVPAGGTQAVLDDFNRADGPIGAGWTIHDGSCNVVSNAASCTNMGRATFNGAPGDGNEAEIDVAVFSTALDYQGLLLNYGAGVSNIMIKVQNQSGGMQFGNAACYTGNNGGGFGLGFFALTSPFGSAHMKVTRVANDVTIEFTNIDGGAQPPQTYVCSGAPAPEGTGIGINGFSGLDRVDNFGGPGEPPMDPDIEVNPTSLSAEQCPDTVTTQTLQICNVGGSDLTWSLSEVPAPLAGSMPFVPVPVAAAEIAGASAIEAFSPAGPLAAPEAPANPKAVLWDQPLSSVNQNAYVNQDFTDLPTYSSFLADDFVNAEPWNISTIFVPGNGWNGFSTLFNASALTWQIYGDNGGVPAGDPSGGGNPPIWTLTLAPTDPQVVITNGSGGMPSNVSLNLATPLAAPAGHWWLVFYPTMPFSGGGQYGRQPADTLNGYWGQFINPGGSFGYGTVWQSWAVIGATQQDIAFRLEGEGGPPPIDIPWLSEDPTAGTLPAGDCVDVTATFDSAGLVPGDFFGDLAVDSNDPDEPTVTVPVQLTVLNCAAEPDIEVTPESLLAEQCPDTQTQQPLDICNVGGADLTWNLSELVPPKGPQAVLWDNGPMVTHPAGGFNSADASAVQTALGLNTYGFGQQYTLSYWMADDFEVADPAGWDLDSITFFAYQTDTYGWPPVSTMTGVYYQVLDGQPGAGGNVICGDTVTNRLTATGWSGIYRVLDTALTNSQRPIMADAASIPTGCEHLDAGTYWIMFSSTGSGGSGPWANPISILGETTTGNALQSLDGGATWNPALDTAAGTQQGMPFVIEGEAGGPPPDIPWLSENPTSGTVLPGQCAQVTVTFDSTGLAPGDYFGDLVIDSNDPDEPQVVVPVQLTVEECADNFMHINRMRMNWRLAGQPGFVKVIALVRIYDQAFTPVVGAEVFGDWTYPDGNVVPGAYVLLTDDLGRTKFRVKEPQFGEYEFCVTGMTLAGYVYDPGANEVPACVSAVTMP